MERQIPGDLTYRQNWKKKKERKTTKTHRYQEQIRLVVARNKGWGIQMDEGGKKV